MRSPASSRQQNAIFPSLIHQTWPKPFSRALYISAPQRPTLYIAPSSNSTQEIPSWTWLKNVNKTRMDRCKTRIEEEKGAVYRVGRCGAWIYDWLPTRRHSSCSVSRMKKLNSHLENDSTRPFWHHAGPRFKMIWLWPIG